jgi:hypothetical protein
MKPSIKSVKRYVVFAFAALLTSTAFSAVIDNAEVIKLLEAGMPEEVILQAIANGQRKFDTSANALIKLKSKGATPAILNAVISPGTATPTRAAPARAATRTAPAAAPSASGGLDPAEVILVSEAGETALQYVVPNIRSAVRGLGFGGFATYAGLDGAKAQMRLPPASLELMVSVPKNLQPTSYVTLASFVVRPNGTREVSIASGVVSYTARIPRERVIPIDMQRAADQSRARDGFVLYRVTTMQPVPSGEFAVVLAGSDSTAGGFVVSSGASYKFFDFGID